MKEFYSLTAAETREQVNHSQNPLSDEEIRARQEKYGPNELAEGKRRACFAFSSNSFRILLLSS